MLRDSALARGGFQLTARYADGPHRGGQAGRFRVEGEGLRIQEGDETPGVLYLQHTDRGTTPGRRGEIRWAFLWIPPPSPSAPVVFHLAANAGNDDASEFGDWIYADSVVLRPE